MNELNDKAAYEQLQELFDFYVDWSTKQLASDLNTGVDTLLKVLAGKKKIGSTFAERISVLYKDKIELPKPPVLPPIEIPPEPPEFEELEKLKKCTFFMYVDGFFGKEERYKTPNQFDFLTEEIEPNEYDGALTRVRSEINSLLEGFFYNTLHIVENPISYDVVYGDDCRESRTYRLELIHEDESLQYYLEYANGRTIKTNFPAESHMQSNVEFVLIKAEAWD